MNCLNLQKKAYLYLLLSISILSPSCSSVSPYFEGAQEFVLDSYQICQLLPQDGLGKVVIMDPYDEVKEIILNGPSISLREVLYHVQECQYVEIVRSDCRFPKIYLLSWEQIAYLPHHSLQLLAGDTIYIKRGPFFSSGNVLHCR